MDSVLQTLEFDKVCTRLASYATSPLGEEIALHLKFIGNRALLLESLNQTSEMRALIDYDDSVPIQGIQDIRQPLDKARIVGSMLHVEELSAVARTLTVTRLLHRYFHARSEKIPFLLKIVAGLQPEDKIEKEIYRCIEVESGEIRDQASHELARLRRDIEHTQSAARKKMETMLKSLGEQGILQENIITVREGRLVFMIKEEYKRKVKGLVLDQSASGSSIFIEPLATLEDNNHIRQLRVAEKKEIERILIHLTDLVRAAHFALLENVERLAQLDFIFAKAMLSKTLNSHQPELVDEPIISFAQGRHPLLCLRMGERNVVPLDLTAGDRFKTLIISGPNAGGKTVALKTIGLLACMVMCGLHIPALPHSRFGTVNRIFASIGDKQSIENDLSTFSSHLSGLKEISETADESSLVLIDEIGSGTDPEEGTALAMALLADLTARGCITIVTTHHNALKAFAYRTDQVENASLEFDGGSLQPTYHFRTGIPGSSYAFEIAKRMGFSQELIEQSRVLVGTHKDKMEGLILELEDKIRHYQQLTQDANLKETELRGLTKLYRERSDLLKSEEKQIKRKAAEQADEIIKKSNAEIERIIREIKESQASKEAITKAREVIARQKAKVQQVRVEIQDRAAAAASEAIHQGDFVRWIKTGNHGQVMSASDRNGRMQIQIEGKMIWVPRAELVKTEPVRNSARTPVNLFVEKPQIVSNEIDVRGLRTDEARDKVDRFLDEMLLAGFTEARIIHGKGTGALRQNIGDFLKSHPRVKTTRLGFWNEGDYGVTVVELGDQ